MGLTWKEAIMETKTPARREVMHSVTHYVINTSRDLSHHVLPRT